MSNKTLSDVQRVIKETDIINEASGNAYSFTPEHALAQLASTGCLYPTYYASAETQLGDVLQLASRCDIEYLAQVAVYSDEKAYMKDMPALLTVFIAAKAAIAAEKEKAIRTAYMKAQHSGEAKSVLDTLYSDLKEANKNAFNYKDILLRVFPRVINTSKKLRNFVQILRSGVCNKKSVGSTIKKLITQWFNHRTADDIFRFSVGKSPSMADVLSIAHPRPNNQEKNALFGWLLGREFDPNNLPPLLKQFEGWKKGQASLPDVPFEMLTAQPLTDQQWKEIARNAGWTWTRMNLNTMLRHKVFDDPEMVELVAKKLSDRTIIQKVKVFPYQLLAAYLNVDPEIPNEIKEALGKAVEISTENVVSFGGKVYVFVDVSGSMNSAVTGYRKGVTSKMRCVDVAALIASVILRRNSDAKVIPFDTGIHKIELSPDRPILENAKVLAINGGGTNCSVPLAYLNSRDEEGDLIIYVSDNESWVDGRPHRYGTNVMSEWIRWRERNPQSKLVCIDLAPHKTTQAYEREDILNIGGFSDTVFDVIARFAKNELDPDHWVSEIKAISL